IVRLVMLVILILNIVRTPKHYDVLVTALILLTTYLSGYSIYLFYTGKALIIHGVEVRAKVTGIFGDPNDLATRFVVSVALAIMRAMQSRGLLRLGYLLLIGITLYAIVLTFSRSGFMALSVVLIGYLIATKLPKKTKTAMAVIGVLLFVAASVVG